MSRLAITVEASDYISAKLQAENIVRQFFGGLDDITLRQVDAQVAIKTVAGDPLVFSVDWIASRIGEDE